MGFPLQNLALEKQISKLAGSKVSYLVIGKWMKAIVDHLYHVVKNTKPGVKKKAMVKLCS